MEPPDLKPGQDIKAWLVAKLGARKEADRDAAKAYLESLGPAGIDLMMDVVKTEATKRRKQRRWATWGFGIYFGIVGVIVLVWLVYALVTGNWTDFPEDIFKFFNVFTAFGVIAAASAVQKAGTQWLAQFPDPRLIGIQIEGLTTNDKKTQEDAQSALTTLLPAIKPEDAEQITPEQREVLRGQLKSKERAFVVVILSALPVLADTAAIPNVEALIHRLERDRRKDADLLAAARSSLAQLEALREQARAKETLLRPAEGAEGDQLLRAAYSNAASDPETLLRPLSNTN